jgi:hypothetical protein
MIVGPDNLASSHLSLALALNPKKEEKKGEEDMLLRASDFDYTPPEGGPAITFLMRDFTGRQVQDKKKKKKKTEDEAQKKAQERDQLKQQHLLKATNSFFLTRRAVYLVCFNLLEYKLGLVGIEYWLQAIEARVPRAPVIIVGLLEDEKKMTLEASKTIIDSMRERYNERNFPGISGFQAVVQKTRAGVPELLKLLQDVATKRKLIKMKVPPAYIQLKEKLRALGEEYEAHNAPQLISWNDFERIGSQFLIGLNEANRVKDLQTVAQFLTEASTLLYFGVEDATMKDLVFLNSMWLLGVLRSIFALAEEGAALDALALALAQFLLAAQVPSWTAVWCTASSLRNGSASTTPPA